MKVDWAQPLTKDDSESIIQAWLATDCSYDAIATLFDVVEGSPEHRKIVAAFLAGAEWHEGKAKQIIGCLPGT